MLWCPAAKGTDAFTVKQPKASGGERRRERSDEDVEPAGTEQAPGDQVMFITSHGHLLLSTAQVELHKNEALPKKKKVF